MSETFNISYLAYYRDTQGQVVRDHDPSPRSPLAKDLTGKTIVNLRDSKRVERHPTVTLHPLQSC